MRFVSTRAHALLDYAVGILLILAPWLLGFNDGSAAQWVPVANGAVVLVMSLFTNYEGGLFKSISVPVHLTVDVLSGIVLAASPWLFGFADRIFLPHLLVGIFEIGAGLCTRTVPYTLLAHPRARR